MNLGSYTDAGFIFNIYNNSHIIINYTTLSDSPAKLNVFIRHIESFFSLLSQTLKLHTHHLTELLESLHKLFIITVF